MQENMPVMVGADAPEERPGCDKPLPAARLSTSAEVRAQRGPAKASPADSEGDWGPTSPPDGWAYADASSTTS